MSSSSMTLRRCASKIGPRLLILSLGFMLLAAALPHGSSAQLQSGEKPQSKAKHSRMEFVPGELLVRFRASSPSFREGGNASLSLSTEGGRRIAMSIERIAGPEILEGLRLARVAPEDTLEAVRALNARADVLYAEPNFIRRAAKTPNDPRYSEQWALHNQSKPGADIHAEQAWDVTTGSKSVVVGIVDEGIDINHQDLKDNIWTNPGEIPGNGVDDDGDGYVDDVNGWDFAHNDNTVFDYTLASYPPPESFEGDVDDHGTHVAGTIGATGNNSTGVAGVNWQVSLMSLKFLTGADGTGSTADLLKALSYARMMRELWNNSGGTKGANIRVLNNSYSGGGFSQSELDAIRALGDAGILFVAAAGNEDQSNDMFPTYPSSYTAANLISVAASNSSDIRANFSNFGPATVNMAAPGDNILSTTPKDTYSFASGTSMATPHVSGAAALVCAAYPNISMRRLRSALIYSGYIAPWQLLNISPVSSARSLDVNGALLSMSDADTTAPSAVGQLRANFPSFPSFTLQWQAPGDDGNTGKATVYEVRFSETDLSDPAKFELALPLPAPLPDVPGTFQSADVRLPWRHASGFIGVRAVDEVGNAGPISTIPISFNTNTADPYAVTESATEPLSTGGTPLGLKADNEYKGYTLPFTFKFYNETFIGVQVSPNGALHLGSAPSPSDGSLDALSSITKLNGYRVIAGAWDDLRTDRRAGDDVYVVRPDDTRIIFRWQGVTTDFPLAPGVNRGENPVNFEIELRIDGTIIMRYGDGNRRMIPVVGLGGGWPDPYVVDSHTALEELKDLTSAQTVTFTPRVPAQMPTFDLNVSMNGAPDPVMTGGQVTYSIRVGVDNGYFPTPPKVTLTDVLPPGTTFVSCTVNNGGLGGTCTGTAVGSTGTVTADLNTLYTYGNYSMVTLVVQVNAAPGTTLSNTASVSSRWTDPTPSNNSATITTDVADNLVFGNATAVAGGDKHTLALKSNGTVWGWGANDNGTLGDGSTSWTTTPVPAVNLTNVVAIAASGQHSMALKSDGTVWTWGNGAVGIGQTDVYFRTSPVQVPGLAGVKAIAAGGSHDLALKTDGTVWAWGYNGAGQLGNTSATDSSLSPVQVTGLSDIVAIAGGQYHSVAVRSDGTVWGFGYNFNGQASPTNTQQYVRTAEQVQGLSDVVSAAAGADHSLALKRNGTVWAWGSSAFGTLGAAATTGRSPVQVTGLAGVAAIAAGYKHSLALKADGTLWAWGRNFGLFGNGTTTDYSATPAQVNIGSVAAIAAASGSFDLAALADGTVRAWGNNSSGQLGDGTYISRQTPAQVSGLSIVSTPIFGLNPDTYSTPQTVYIYCNTGGATIHYTTNGNDPTEGDPVIATGSSVYLDRTTTLKAKAWKAGFLPSKVRAATYTISLPPNPIDDAQTFVRQQYMDFLNREPDAGGLGYWTGQITNCGTNADCIHDRRVGVADAFFFEAEFQQTGGYIYRIYRAGLGRRPTFEQFMGDRGFVVAGSGLDQSKTAYALNFVGRDGFVQKYPRSQSAAEFVDALLAAVRQNSQVDLSAQRAALMALYDGTDNGRAAILRQVADNSLVVDAEYNSSFVLMEYFGYLRRDPDPGGFDFWIGQVNKYPLRNVSIQHAMACSFITSAEYQRRFGTSVTHTNRECPQ